MLVRFFDIVWDTDGEQVELPSEVILKVEDGTELATEGADVLSDKFGWCVKSFNFEYRTPATKCRAVPYVEEHGSAYFLIQMAHRKVLFSCPCNKDGSPALDELTSEYERVLFPQCEIDRLTALLTD